jgi:ABC-2 type transport system permease protein
VRLYWELAVRGYQRSAIYRSAAISGAITNTFFGFLRAYVFIALYQTRPEVGGYSMVDALTFTFLTQAMIGPVEPWGSWRISETVQSGQIATDLSRPFDFQLYWLVQDYGRALHQFLLRSIAPTLVAMAFFEMRFPPDLLHWVAMFCSFVIAIAVSFGWRFCLNLSTFWMLDYRGVAALSALPSLLLSGFYVPLPMFPEEIRPLLYLNPLASMVQVPIDVYLGKSVGAELAMALAGQVFWAIALLLAGRVLLRFALRKLVVQGG